MDNNLEKCEPVAYIHTATNTDKDGVEWVQLKAIDTSPQPRDWVGLSNDDINKLKNLEGANRERTATEMAFAVQAKLRELNT